jgi:hypothetical protein
MHPSDFRLPLILATFAVASFIVPQQVSSQGNQESENVADQFTKNVEQRQWRAAEYFARRSPEFASMVLLKQWQALRDSNDPHSKRIRLESDRIPFATLRERSLQFAGTS